ncbi:MAG: TlpA family protein disulfide reductase [Candidatus Omnitrophica bacterium]|nr:TlpA family protein disulfide reductase [Candidatus Omnitrophota bacterium]
MRRNIRFITMVALVALAFYPVQASGQVFFMENPNVGKEAQEFTLKVLDGTEVNLSEVRKGKKAVILFWATWCPHCRGALNGLRQKKQEIENQDIKIILIDVGESREVVGKFFEKNGIDMDVFLDEATEVSEIYGVVGIPTFYFIGEDGIIRKVRNSLPQDLEMVFYGA